MEINRYSKQNRLHKAASEYEASQIKAQHIKPSAREQQPVQINKNEHSIIKGEVIDLRYQEVKIRLDPSGQVITARLTGELPLSIGQTAEFAVSDEVDGQITLRYISNANTPANEITFKALSASGLIASERNLAIVQELLNLQMPVDKNTILQLIKLTSTYPDVSLPRLALMHKNNLPINISNIAQFEDYQKGTHQILSQLQSLISDISIELGNEVIVNNKTNPNANDIYDANADTDLEVFLDQDVEVNRSTKDNINLYKELLTLLGDGKSTLAQIDPNTTIDHILTSDVLTQFQENILKALNESRHTNPEMLEDIKDQLLSPSITLSDLLRHTHNLYVDENLQPYIESKLLTSPILVALLGMVDDLSAADRSKLLTLLKYDSSQEIISKLLHERWTLTPKELTEENKVKEFFKGLDDDMEQLKVLTNTTKVLDLNSDSVKASINKLQDNLQFMRDLNELLLYLQLPMRLSGQDAHGDLYVFTRKNQKHLTTKGLNILLHLDMTNLGSMDIHLSMNNRQIMAVFYVEEPSREIIAKHLNELSEVLSDKGYQFQAKTKISHSKPDFITDILLEDNPNLKTLRYSFDIRA